MNRLLGFASLVSTMPLVASYSNGPFSNVDPISLQFLEADRPDVSMPGPALTVVSTSHTSLPTNSWCQNLMIGSGEHDENRVYQVPYVIDVASSITGIRTNPIHIYADSTQVMVQFEANNGLTLGASESNVFQTQHQIQADADDSICSLFLDLEWASQSDPSVKMNAHIARGSPYSSMMYSKATPLVFAQQVLSKMPVVDGSSTLTCGNQSGSFSDQSVRVESHLELQFIASDMTWLVFFSEPTTVECWNADNQFQLRSISPMTLGMVRVALANNCTTGSNPMYCASGGAPTDQSAFTEQLITHADVYATGAAYVDYSVSIAENGVGEDSMLVVLDWQSASMSDIAPTSDRKKKSLEEEPPTLLTYALPHHASLLTSDTSVLAVGCTPTLHGTACPALGAAWTLQQPVRAVSFDYSASSPREEMLEDLKTALDVDIHYEIPDNYMRGAGDTYFSGKMLAKLARILLAADTLGMDKTSPDFQSALQRLQQGTEVWFNGSAAAPFLYDDAWGGVSSCGCNYDEGTDTCTNVYPNCPALSDSGQNFGFGFYNDHHFHLGYHIYSAAVVAKYNPSWAAKHFESVLLYIRDIANPSLDDDYFIPWRHKDWYLGFSWASGVVTVNNEPYLNGRNEESSSEAVAAYEAVALFGQVCAEVVFTSPEDEEKRDIAYRIRDTGLVMLSTEITGAQMFWHVQSSDSADAVRVYPEIYANKVVGMLWSTLAQMQTWFGGAPYLCFGIQLLPITPVWENRDTLSWVNEMLPYFESSCSSTGACETDGWSVVLYAHMATAGQWEDAWKGVQSLADAVFESSGGNGHSRTNTLLYIATHGVATDDTKK
jgi:endoglucanase Acf2